jgi:phosphoglycolate phosphatase
MPFRLPTRLSKEHATKLINEVENFLFDCDGVIWNWPHSIEGSIEFINKLKELNKKCFFVTNNSTKTRDTYVHMLNKVGVNNVTENDVVCTSWVLARYLKQINFQDKCYVVGSPALAEELDRVNVQHYGVGPTQHDIPDPASFDYINNIKLDPSVKCVVAGFDHYFNYPKIVKATSYAFNNPDVLFIATNDDAQFPFNNKLNSKTIIPGTGKIDHFWRLKSSQSYKFLKYNYDRFNCEFP